MALELDRDAPRAEQMNIDEVEARAKRMLVQAEEERKIAKDIISSCEKLRQLGATAWPPGPEPGPEPTTKEKDADTEAGS